MNGKTHDLQVSKGGIKAYYGMCIFLLIFGAGMVIGAVILNDPIVYGTIGLIGAALIVTGLYKFGQRHQFTRFAGYGIDEDRETIWDAVFQEGLSRPVDMYEIPFQSIRTVLLAPHMMFTTYKTSNTTYNKYFYVPVVFVVYEKNGELHHFQVQFNDEDGPNEWLTKAQQAGLPLYWTDEAVNNLYKEPDMPELLEHDIHKEPLHFNGSILSYINRKRREDHQYLPMFQKGESHELNDKNFVRFDYKLKQIFFTVTILLVAVLSIEQWYVTTRLGIYTGAVTTVGLTAGTLILSASHLLYSYAIKRFRLHSVFIILGLSIATYLVASIAADLIVYTTQTHDPGMNLLFWYVTCFIPLVILSGGIRKWKPAHHHFKVQQKKERLRFSSGKS